MLWISVLTLLSLTLSLQAVEINCWRCEGEPDPKGLEVRTDTRELDLMVCRNSSDLGIRYECEDEYHECYQAHINCTSKGMDQSFYFRGCGKVPKLGITRNYEPEAHSGKHGELTFILYSVSCS